MDNVYVIRRLGRLLKLLAEAALVLAVADMAQSDVETAHQLGSESGVDLPAADEVKAGSEEGRRFVCAIRAAAAARAVHKALKFVVIPVLQILRQPAQFLRRPRQLEMTATQHLHLASGLGVGAAEAQRWPEVWGPVLAPSIDAVDGLTASLHDVPLILLNVSFQLRGEGGLLVGREGIVDFGSGSCFDVASANECPSMT